MELEGKWVRAFGGAATQNVLIPQMNTAEITFLPIRPKCLRNKAGTIFLWLSVVSSQVSVKRFSSHEGKSAEICRNAQAKTPSLTHN